MDYYSNPEYLRINGILESLGFIPYFNLNIDSDSNPFLLNFISDVIKLFFLLYFYLFSGLRI